MTTAPDIARELASKVESLCVTLLPNGKRCGGEWRVGSLDGESGGSLGVRLHGAKAGVWCDFATGEAGDGLDLVAAVLSISIGDAMRWATNWLGLPAYATKSPRPAAVSARSAGVDDTANLEIARCIWRESGPIAGTLGERYLRHVRGINLETWPPTLRFHARLYYGPKRNNIVLPGIVAPVQSTNGAFRGVWRIFLDPKTGDKAPVDSQRKGLGPVSGGAIRLAPVTEDLVLGEGLESCLSVICGIGLACWSGMSASLMRNVQLPAQVRRVCLLEENDIPDRNGRRASPDAVRVLAQRYLTEGRETWIVRPPPHLNDMNDFLMGTARHA